MKPVGGLVAARIIGTQKVWFRKSIVGDRIDKWEGVTDLKPMIQYRIQETAVQVIHGDGEVAIKNGILIEGEQLCTIYDLDEELACS